MDKTSTRITDSIQTFVACRDDLLHEDEATFEYQLERFLQFCDTDELLQSVLQPVLSAVPVDLDAWWAKAGSRDGDVVFPTAKDEDLALRYHILRGLRSQPNLVIRFGMAFGKHKRDDAIEVFRSVVVRPLAAELTHRIGDAANIASPEARTLQAVPLHRIPSPNEIKIFLSHKSVDKPMVRRYYEALKALGFSPWLDESNMPAGANLERELLAGFEHSCAAVFFITESFKDASYLATEIEYAIMQKRQKRKKFAIITLRYHSSAVVPGLLTPYIYRDIANDLEGFKVILDALPIELGPVRWKTGAVTD
jgi:hypothetical protein